MTSKSTESPRVKLNKKCADTFVRDSEAVSKQMQQALGELRSSDTTAKPKM